LTNHTQPKRMPGPSARRIRQYPGLGNALGSSDLRVLGPEASTRELHQKNHGELQNQKSETLCEWSPTGEYSQRVVVPISSEPAPSHRPWTFASGATPARTTPTYHRVNRKPGKIGTFYLAGNRNFLLGLDTWKMVFCPTMRAARIAHQFYPLACPRTDLRGRMRSVTTAVPGSGRIGSAGISRGSALGCR